jgi:hypothetical protein
MNAEIMSVGYCTRGEHPQPNSRGESLGTRLACDLAMSSSLPQSTLCRSSASFLERDEVTRRRLANRRELNTQGGGEGGAAAERMR